jgi:hypothetical protein
MQDRLVFEMMIFVSFTKSQIKAGDDVSGSVRIDLDMRRRIIALISDANDSFVMRMHV